MSNELLEQWRDFIHKVAWEKAIEKKIRSTRRLLWFLLGTMGITCLVCIVGIVLNVLLGG